MCLRSSWFIGSTLADGFRVLTKTARCGVVAVAIAVRRADAVPFDELLPKVGWGACEGLSTGRGGQRSPCAIGRLRPLCRTRLGYTAQSTHQGVDPIRDLLNVLVFPHSDNGPTQSLKLASRFQVAPPIGFDLVGPELGVRLGHRVVLGTAVPEATVYVNGHLAPWEENVGGPTYVAQGSTIQIEAESPRVQHPSKRQLRSRVAASVGLHARSDTWRRSPGVGFGHVFDRTGAPAQRPTLRNLG